MVHTGTGVLRSDGGIISALRACGGSRPLLTFCWMKCMAKANCSRVNFPICRVSAKPLWTETQTSFKLPCSHVLFSCDHVHKVSNGGWHRNVCNLLKSVILLAGLGQTGKKVEVDLTQSPPPPPHMKLVVTHHSVPGACHWATEHAEWAIGERALIGYSFHVGKP